MNDIQKAFAEAKTFESPWGARRSLPPMLPEAPTLPEDLVPAPLRPPGCATSPSAPRSPWITLQPLPWWLYPA